MCHRSGVAVAVAVANAGIVFSEDTTDYAVGLLLDVLHRIFELDRYVQSGRWSSRGDYPLFGSKVLSLFYFILLLFFLIL